MWLPENHINGMWLIQSFKIVINQAIECMIINKKELNKAYIFSNYPNFTHDKIYVKIMIRQIVPTKLIITIEIVTM